VLTPNTTPADWAALDLSGSAVTSVTIASPPVVNFKLANKDGVPVIGFGTTSKSSTQTIARVNSLSFALAKLVPGSGGTPSKWVNYIVTSVNQTTGAVTLSRPSTDNYGTLVDNGDGTYTYTFYRDVPGIKAQVDGITPPSGNKADLGDLTYDANATHRLVIQISGDAPGTGSNTPTGAASGVTGVPLQKPVDLIHDFVPATGAAPAANANRKMVANANCESCHSTLGGLPGGSGESLVFHSGGRNNIEYCVICHTDQRKFQRTEAPWDPITREFTGGGNTDVVDGRAIGNVVNFVHKIHVAGVMTKTEYNYHDVFFDKGGYSQDIRNCDKCHDSTGQSTGGTPLPQASLWKTNANRIACGSCHDGINFDTGQGMTLAGETTGPFTNNAVHPANSTDGTCLNSSCHNPGAPADPDLVHKPVTPPSLNNSLQVPKSSEVPGSTGNDNTNSAWIASNQNRLPEGAIKVSYDIKSVSVVDVAGVRRPRMVFRMLQNGARKDLNDVAASADNPVTGQKEMWDGFMGGPSLYFVWAVPQDGITTPADFNASGAMYLRCLWNGTAPLPDPDTCISTSGTLTGPDGEGYYTATLTGIIIPPEAVMVTGGMGYSYNVRSTLPLTQTNVPGYPATKQTGAQFTGLTAGMPNAYGGLIVIAPNVQKVADSGCVASTNSSICASSGAFVGRRAIVEDKRCGACHQELGTFTEDAFHAGQRNDGTTCSWCHTPNRASSGWTADSVQIMHGIHGAAKRTVDYTWHATCPTTATTIDDCGGFWEIKYPGVLARCEQCHIPGSYDFSNSASADAAGLVDGLNKRQHKYVYGNMAAAGSVGALYLSPYVMAGAAYGGSFSFNATTGVTTLPADTTLIQSPTVAACAGCHTSPLAISHMEVNGGRFYRARTTQFAPGADTPSGTATTEQCMVCHATGRIADTKVVHNP